MRLSTMISCPMAVAPFAGAWIEISMVGRDISDTNGRSLRGSVD